MPFYQPSIRTPPCPVTDGIACRTLRERASSRRAGEAPRGPRVRACARVAHGPAARPRCSTARVAPAKSATFMLWKMLRAASSRSAHVRP